MNQPAKIFSTDPHPPSARPPTVRRSEALRYWHMLRSNDSRGGRATPPETRMVVPDRLRGKKLFFSSPLRQSEQNGCRILGAARGTGSVHRLGTREKKEFGNILARRGVCGICRRQIALLARTPAGSQTALGRVRVRQLLRLASRRSGLLDSDDPGSLWRRSLVYGCLRQRPRTRARALEDW